MKRGVCSCHNRENYIVNIKYNLCSIGNRNRIDNTKSGKKRLDRLNKKESDLKEAYKIVEKRESFCSGCGQSSLLSKSHIIARSKNRDLIANPDNIVYDCLQREIPDQFGIKGCHSRWESFNIEEMLTLDNFWERMDFVKKHEIEMYNKIMILYNNG